MLEAVILAAVTDEPPRARAIVRFRPEVAQNTFEAAIQVIAGDAIRFHFVANVNALHHGRGERADFGARFLPRPMDGALRAMERFRESRRTVRGGERIERGLQFMIHVRLRLIRARIVRNTNTVDGQQSRAPDALERRSEAHRAERS